MVAPVLLLALLLFSYLVALTFGLVRHLRIVQSTLQAALSENKAGVRSSSFNSTQASQTSSHLKLRTREPSLFGGKASDLIEWMFVVEQQLERANLDGSAEVAFAVSFFTDNALRWFLLARESGTIFSSWSELKSALHGAFGPCNSDELNRLNLFDIRQTDSLERYETEFSRLSLSVPELDELSRTLLFLRGLRSELRSEASREHPRTLAAAVRAARLAEQNLGLERRQNGGRYDNAFRPENRLTSKSSGLAKRRKLDDVERQKLSREGRCFYCREIGHMSRDCPKLIGKVVPNAGSQ